MDALASSSPLFRASDLVRWIEGRVLNAEELGAGALDRPIRRPAPLAIAAADDVGFYFSREYDRELLTARPGVLITGHAFAAGLKAAGLPLWKSSLVVACADPYSAMARVLREFAPSLIGDAYLGHVAPDGETTARPEVHPSAVVSALAQLGPGVVVGPLCVIEDGAVIGARTVLTSQCTVGRNSTLGEGCILFPGVRIYERVTLGARVRVHANTVIGSDGFGYAPQVRDRKVVGHQKIFHLGIVVIEDDVDIGAACTIDRGTLGETRIGAQSKLDDQVHIGHNATLGKGAVLCGGVFLAGRAEIADFAYLGGMTGVSNAVRVGAQAKVGAMSLVTRDVPDGELAAGNPQRELKEHFKAHAALNRLLANKTKENRGK